jgi:signal transduction histidine kinase
MRWWLALVFALIAALTAVTVARVFESTAERAILERAADLTAGSALAAASEISQDASVDEIEATVANVSLRRRVSVFVFDEDGQLLSAERVGGHAFVSLPNGELLLEEALDGRRSVETIEEGRRVTVSLPLRGGPGAALVAVASRPDLEAALGIVHDRIVPAALWAIAAGALVGLVIATLIARRLRRIASAASEIERGQFDRPLTPGFPDELGRLASVVDSMRERLATSFADLEVERDRLSRLLEQLQEGVIAVDHELNVSFANSRARALLGAELRAGTQVPNPWRNLSLSAMARGLFAPGASIATVQTQTDSWQTYTVTGLPPSLDGELAVLVINDETERVRRERAEREFVTNAAHELRTPLTALASAVDILQRGAKEEPVQRDRFLAVVERQTARLSGLVRALLTLARAQTGAEAVPLEPVLVAPLLREIADEAPEGTVTVTCPAELTARSHADLLRQALSNLVANALKHGGGDRVDVSATSLADGTITITVSDHGPGMTPDVVERVFERFYRGQAWDGDGHGLGLAIVRQAVQVIDGTIEANSEPGRGTTMTIALPPVETRREAGGGVTMVGR